MSTTSSTSPAPEPQSPADRLDSVGSKQQEKGESSLIPPRGNSEEEGPESASQLPTLQASTSAAANTSASASASPYLSTSPAVASAGDWQAIWSPAHNAYYFYNAKTQETTWTNPLQPAPADPVAAGLSPSSGSASPDAGLPASAATQSMYDLQAAAAAQGIDPALAYLDPSLVAGPSSVAADQGYTAKFNARTGAFTRPDGRDPSHLSEYERAKRMSEFYFDVNAWERDVEQRKLEEAQEEEGKKRKRPTKKDLERFKEQKRLKKIAKTAWLRT
ncbi:hypothetical protein AcW1_002777 [Taiwanofungus camphoratus]|nr:hypothetical protein AcV5_009549 [Antrodia cinnamomea]KAI0943676.1 hypothetical protein AcW1_002777 [Antrodia cinnamomea]